jgi:adenosylcobinamide-phosphate synthase
VSLSSAAARPLGLALGVVLDHVVGDPHRLHPVAGYGRVASNLEHRWYADDTWSGVRYTAVAVGIPLGVGFALERVTAARPLLRTLLTAVATWVVLGGTSLAQEGSAMADLLEAGKVEGARQRLRNLCARDSTGMAPGDLARATVESLAENASDAVVAPLLWGSVAGLPGLLGYRAVNTLDAMIGYTSARYLRFGWAAARLEDLVNLVPARVTGALVVPAPGGGRSSAGVAGSAPRRPRAPEPERGQAGGRSRRRARGVSGGENTYGGQTERRPELGDGRGPDRGRPQGNGSVER